MIRRWRNEDGSETIIIVEDEPRRSFLEHVFRFVGITLLIAFLSVIPTYLIYTGIKGLKTGQIRMKYGDIAYGDEAITHSWVSIGFGTTMFVVLLVTWLSCRFPRKKEILHSQTPD